MTTAERLAAAIEKLEAAKNQMSEALTGVEREQAFAGAQWSIADILRHATNREGGYPSWIRNLATNPDYVSPFAGGFGGMWPSMVKNASSVVDEMIGFANSLNEEQLLRRMQFGQRELDVIEMLERMAGHYEEHAAEIGKLAGK